MNTKVRKTTLEDIDRVMAIYDYARERMRMSGNHAQWVNGYPSEQAIRADIAASNSYVVEINGRVAGVFTFVIGDEPTYQEIEGAWLDDSPYGTIHRIAAGRGYKGIADIALDYCLRQGVDIRIDTHKDNIPMLGWINTRGFRYCGVIHVSDGTPREAFQLRQHSSKMMNHSSFSNGEVI